MTTRVRPAFRNAAPATLAIALATSIAFAAQPAAGASCPASEMSFNGIDTFTSTAPTYDSGVGSARVAYNLPQGTVEVYHCCGLGTGYTAARDAYDVIGVPAGTAIDLVAEMPFDGTIISLGCGASGCWGNLEGRITSGSASQKLLITRNLFAPITVPVSGFVQLPITIVAGQPQVIEFRLSAWKSAGGNHGASGTGHIGFRGLPVGAGVISCNGYALTPVPALRRSWGQLKMLYR